MDRQTHTHTQCYQKIMHIVKYTHVTQVDTNRHRYTDNTRTQFLSASHRNS